MSFTQSGFFPAGAGPDTISCAVVSSTTVSQKAAQFGSSRRAPSRNSGVCSEASCSSASASQISAMPWCGSPGSPAAAVSAGSLLSMRYFLICGILLA